MTPNELIYAVTTLAAAMAENRSNAEITVLSAIFTQLGDTLATIVTQRATCQNTQPEKPD